MQLQYRMLGADGKEYGPATLEELQSWIHQGRLNADTQIWRTDQANWRRAGEFDEFIWAPPVASSQPPVSESELQAEQKMKSGAAWFYWIAAMTGINTISLIAGGDWAFVIGLGITQVFDAFGREMGSVGSAVAVLLDLIAIAAFVLFGYFGKKAHAWAFIVGMSVYAIDSIIPLLAEDWLSLGFHGFAIFCIFNGFNACRQLKKVRSGA